MFSDEVERMCVQHAGPSVNAEVVLQGEKTRDPVKLGQTGGKGQWESCQQGGSSGDAFSPHNFLKEETYLITLCDGFKIYM